VNDSKSEDKNNTERNSKIVSCSRENNNNNNNQTKQTNIGITTSAKVLVLFFAYHEKHVEALIEDPTK